MWIPGLLARAVSRREWVWVWGLNFIFFLSFLRARGGVFLFYGLFWCLGVVFGVVLASTATERASLVAHSTKII